MRALLLISAVALFSRAAAGDELVPRTTRWPAALPCARFAEAVIFASHDAELDWSGGGARFTRTLTGMTPDPQHLALDENFPVGKLTRLRVTPRQAVAPRAFSLGLQLRCKDDPELGIAWGQGADRGLAATFAVPDTPGLAPVDVAATQPVQSVTRDRDEKLLRVAHGKATSLHALLRTLCAAPRCSKALRAVDDRLATVAGATWRVAEVRERSDDMPGLKHRGWQARLTAGGVTLELDCGVHIFDSANTVELYPECKADFGRGGRSLLREREPTWLEISDGSGGLRVRDRRITIYGSALELAATP